MIKRVYYKIKLFSNPRKELFYSLYDITGFFPKNIKYYELALRHRSKPLRTEDGTMLNNERLEFLGDSVLNSIISDILYHQYPKEKEGFLTNARAHIVKRHSLNKLCRMINLDKLIVAAKHVNLHKERNLSILGNALEAFIGAVYLDLGYRRCMAFVKQKMIVSPDDLKNICEANENPKSELIEWCQKYYLSFDFVVENDIVELNKHSFTTRLNIEGIKISSGKGASKKESEQNAAVHALEIIKENPAFLEEIKRKNQEHQEIVAKN